MSSSIQQLQELVGDIVDSGNYGHHIPGQQDLGTTDTYPVMHTDGMTPHTSVHDCTPQEQGNTPQYQATDVAGAPVAASQPKIHVLERQPSFVVTPVVIPDSRQTIPDSRQTIPDSRQTTVLIPEVAPGSSRQSTTRHTLQEGPVIGVTDIPEVKPPKVPPKVAPKPTTTTNAHTTPITAGPELSRKTHPNHNDVAAVEHEEVDDVTVVEQEIKATVVTADVPDTSYTDMTATIQDTGEKVRSKEVKRGQQMPPNLANNHTEVIGGQQIQTNLANNLTEPHYLNDDQMPQPPRGPHQPTTIPTPQQIPKLPYHMQQEMPPPYQSHPNSPEVPRSPCRFHANMLPPSPYHSNSNTPGLSRVPCHRFTHTFEDDSYSLNSTLTSLEVGHLQAANRTPCQVASSSLESQFRLPINRRGLFLQDSVFEKSAPVLQSAIREVLGRGWGPGRHTTMADEMVRYRNMRAGDMEGRTQVAVITRTDTYYLIVVDMHEYLEGSMQLKVGACCSVLVEGWLEIEEGDEIITYDFNRCFPTPDMAELKDISADLSSDGIICITVPTIPLDDISYRPGPRYNDSSYEPLVDIDLHRQSTTVLPIRTSDNRNPRYAKYWHDSHHQEPSLQPLVDTADIHCHNNTTSTVRLEGSGVRLDSPGVRLECPMVPGKDRQVMGEGADENSYTYKSCRSDSVSSNRSYPVVC